MKFDQQLNNERDILQKLAEGQEQALRLLLHHYNPVLTGFIDTFTQSRERTEEIIQDIFMQVWLMRDNLMEINNMRAFLFVMARNEALNAIKAEMREQKRREEFEKRREFEPEDDPKNGTTLQMIEEAIENLPPQMKRAWTLSRREGKKYEEIAVIMAISRETVKSYIQSANAWITKYVRKKLLILIIIAQIF
jgi:RNA polymerase sigma factor (sigma-70 family)